MDPMAMDSFAPGESKLSRDIMLWSEPAVLFGPFRLLPRQRLLLEGDLPVRLGSRALDILIALVRRAGSLVTKRELMAAVWPDTVVVESNLTVHITSLRKLLRDGEGGRRYIVNVVGRGYCFVASVRHTEAEPSIAA